MWRRSGDGASARAASAVAKCTGEIRPEFAVHRRRFPRACERFLIGRPAGPDWLRRFGSEREDLLENAGDGCAPPRATRDRHSRTHNSTHNGCHHHLFRHRGARRQGARATSASRRLRRAFRQVSKARFVCRAEGEVR